MNLSINYEETGRIGNQLISKAEEFNQLLGNINNINSQIAENWTGADASKYLSAVNEQAQYMRQLAATISEIGNYLIKVSNIYQEAAANNSSSIIL